MTGRLARVTLATLAACAPHRPTTGAPSDEFVVRNAHLIGTAGLHAVAVRAGRITGIDADTDGLPTMDAAGGWLVPGVIDSHVHLAYLPAADALADAGVAVAIDLAAPKAWRRPTAPQVLGSGPMITAINGYPTLSWGRDGYGWPVASPEQARDAVSTLVDDGARVIKVAVTSPPTLDDATLAATVSAAHDAHIPVVAHALSDVDAARAAAAGVDGLAHTPTEALSDATIAAWSGRFVISTIAAFGGDAVDNLRRLRAAGATVLYGTDFGNTAQIGVSPDELDGLARAGLDGAAIADALGPAPAAVWHLPDVGAIRVGATASMMLVPADPLADPTAWTRPETVWLAGHARR